MTTLAPAVGTAAQTAPVIELPPAGTLAGLVKRELPGVSIHKLAGPHDLAAARELLGPAVLDLEAPELLSAGARS